MDFGCMLKLAAWSGCGDVQTTFLVVPGVSVGGGKSRNRCPRTATKVVCAAHRYGQQRNDAGEDDGEDGGADESGESSPPWRGYRRNNGGGSNNGSSGNRSRSGRADWYRSRNEPSGRQSRKLPGQSGDERTDQPGPMTRRFPLREKRRRFDAPAARYKQDRPRSNEQDNGASGSESKWNGSQNTPDERRLPQQQKMKEQFMSYLSRRHQDAFRFSRETRWQPDATDLNDILSHLAKRRHISTALEVIREAEVTWKLVPPRNRKTAALVIEVYGRAAMLDKAIRTFDFIESLGGEMNTACFNALIAASARCKRPDISFDLIDKMHARGIRPDKFTFGSIIDALGKAGDVEKACEVADMMEAQGIAMDQASYSALIDACGRAGRLDAAVAVFEDMKNRGVWPNVITFAVMIEACAKSQKFERAFEMFREMKQWNIQPNVVIYTCLIDACCKARRMDNAEKVLADMRMSGVPPNLVTFSSMIHGYCIIGDLDSSFELLQSMPADGCEPNGRILTSLLHFCKVLNRPDLIPLIWDMHVKYPQYIAPSFYLRMVALSSQAGDVRLGLDVARRIAREVGAIGPAQRRSFARVFNGLLRAARASGDDTSTKAITGLLRELEFHRFPP